MAKKSRKQSRKGGFWASEAGKKTFVVLLGLVAFGGLLAVINGFQGRGPGASVGVGADGFSIFEVQGADLGIAEVVKKPLVEAELGGLVNSIDDVQKSSVVSVNGDKGQTATYYFVAKDGAQGSFYVDVMEYKSKAAYDKAKVFEYTLDAGKINGNEAHYMKAATIANEREYALLVTKGLNSYKFALTQAFKNVKISEETAQAALKKIAEKAAL